MPERANKTDAKIATALPTPSDYIDNLLQGVYLFVMEVRHNHALIRDAGFYQRGMKLVESVQSQLKLASVSESFSNHIIYALCGLLDESVLNSASGEVNNVWRANPLQGVFIHTFNAGTDLPERLRELLRQPAPDPRLLVLYQRIFAFGFGRHNRAGVAERQKLIEAVNARVPDFEQPLSLPLIVSDRARSQNRLLHSRIFWLVTALIVTGGLFFGLRLSLKYLLASTL